MRALDIMTTHVVSVSGDTSIEDVAAILLKHRISAVPVVDSNNSVIGMVSEGDLMRRPEIGTDNRHSWWLAQVLSTRDRASDYIKTHGHIASDVMTKGAISVDDGTPINEIAGLLEKHHIKRVPVVRDGQLVGIVSRANLLQALAARGARDSAPAAAGSDQNLREELIREITAVAGIDAPLINVIVTDGVAQLYGIVDSLDKKQAVQIAAENVAGVKAIENHLGRVPAWVFSA